MDERQNGPSEDTRKKAQAAKSYIENMYKVQYQNFQQRTDRFTSLSMLYFGACQATLNTHIVAQTPSTGKTASDTNIVR